MAKACVKCKQRKKKCSGGVPCDYCLKIDEPQGCEYKTRVKSKVAKVTERYILSLKNRIQQLEAQLAKTASEVPENTEQPLTTSDINPLMESENGLEYGFQAPPSKLSTRDRYLGLSSCAQFLKKVKQSLPNSIDANVVASKDCTLAALKVHTEPQIDPFRIEKILNEIIPDFKEARKLIQNASEMIGADYMFIEKDYADITVKKMLDRDQIPKKPEDLLQFTIELLRLMTCLALGSLFDRSNESSRYMGVTFHRASLSLYGSLAYAFDQASSAALVQSLLNMAYFALSQNKTTFAFATVGTAIRTMFTLGYHKKTQSMIENRTFWLCFIYDRLLAVRFGFPLMIGERDINAPIFNEADESQTTVSLDVYHFVAQVKLAMITTQIISKIYMQNPFSFLHNCHAVLKQLKHWFDSLPNELKFDYDDIKTGMIRSTFNLHINYNYSIIITTRPVLLYVVNMIFSNTGDEEKTLEQGQCDLISGLLESCIQAAEIQSRILAKLYYDGKMAVCSFLDCHYIFGATIILILAGYCQMHMEQSVLYSGDIELLFDAINHNLKILQRLSEYNVVARNFNEQLTEFIETMSSKEVVGPLEKEDGQRQNSPLSFSQNFKRQNSTLNDLEEDEKRIFDLDDLAFVDLSHLLNYIDDQFPSTSMVDQFLERDFLSNNCREP
ncbi:LAMI_0D00232g1_1 [Lachancea mirantina]|uniref:LAMI_0D00232g1_1 n=1 Tax=Lachancea mirantina TaxID=1230905 RepID=A0A1G4J867_9SACH|nr:LAMI_0D00232g1_1 [Lachancea mirantina]